MIPANGASAHRGRLFATALGVIVLAVGLSGCGRKGALEPPPAAVTSTYANPTGQQTQQQDPNAEKYIGEAQLLYKQEEEKRKQDLKTPPPAGDETTEPDAG